MDYGFQAVVSPRFGDIFRNNATKTGLIPIQVDQEVADLLIKAAGEEPGLQMTIDVEKRTLSVPGDRRRSLVSAGRLHAVSDS